MRLYCYVTAIPAIFSFVCKNMAFQQFEGAYNVTCAQLVALVAPSVSLSTDEEKKVIADVKELQLQLAAIQTEASQPPPSPISLAALPYSVARKVPLSELLKIAVKAVVRLFYRLFLFVFRG